MPYPCPSSPTLLLLSGCGTKGDLMASLQKIAGHRVTHDSEAEKT